MHDDFAKIGAAAEKRLAHPQQVFLALLQQRYAGAYAGMTQEIPADDQRRMERGEKIEMRLRHRGPQSFGRRLIILAPHQRADIDAYECKVSNPPRRRQ